MRRTALSTLMIGAALGAVALTGCSSGTGSASSGDQSVADACAVATETISSVQQDVLAAQADAQGADGEPKVEAQIELYGKVGDAVTEAAGKVTNAEVKSALDALASGYRDIVAAAQAAVSDPSDTAAVEKLQAVGTDVQTEMTKYSELCGS